MLRRLLDRLPAALLPHWRSHASAASCLTPGDRLLRRTLDTLFRRRPLIEEVEPRLLFSADLAPVALDGLTPAPEQRVLDADGEYARSASALRQELVIVDTGVDGYQGLLDDLLGRADAGRHLEVVMIDPGHDGVDQIGDALHGRSGLDAVHLISHGASGALQLGNASLDAARLEARAADIAAWGAALSADADLLLYGCKVAAGAEGEAFLATLARLTGADVAASDDLSGTGGDWVLEFNSGRIETANALSAGAQEAWRGTLAITDNGTTSATTGGDQTSLTFSHTVGAGADGLLVVEIMIRGNVPVTSVTYGGVALTLQGAATSTGNEVRAEIWALTAPVAGTADVVITTSASTSVVAGASSFLGVDQGAPLGVVRSATGSDAAPTLTLTSRPGERVLDVAGALWVGNHTVGPGQAEAWSNKTGASNNDVWAVSSTENGAAAVTLSHGYEAMGAGAEQWVALAVAIKPAGAPVITSDSGGDSASVAVGENTTAVTTVIASDVDGPALTYSISGGADASKFAIDSASGALNFLNAPDYETPLDSNGDNTYEVIVRADDGTLWDEQTLAVTVTDVGGPLAVTTVDDVLDGDTRSVEAVLANPGTDGLISLREAIIAANNTSGADTILLANGTYTLTLGGGGGGDTPETGDLDILDGLSILGTGAGLTNIDGLGLDRVFDASAGLSLTDLTVRGGSGSWGGGLYLDNATAELVRVTFEDNTSSVGGAIYNYHGTLNITDSALQGNTAGWGGAIYNDGGMATLVRTTVSGNAAPVGGGGLYSGGVHAGVDARVLLVNSTLSGNGAALGGAIYSSKGVDLVSSTIAFNTAADGGGLYLSGGGSVATLVNTVLAGNTGGNANTTLTSLGHNLDSDGTAGLAGAGDLTGIDPLLAPLADNGGHTQTHALLDGSAALDAGDTVAAPATDQRGEARVGVVDIGAFEASASVNRPPANTVSGPLSAPENTATPIGGLSIADGNEGGGIPLHELAEVQLSVSYGILHLTLAGSATISAGANASATLTLSGSQADINTSLASLAYQSDIGFTGSDTLTVFSQDGAGLTDTDTVDITVTAHNDAPTVAVPLSDQSVTEDTPFSFTFDAGSFADADAGDTLTYSTSGLPAWLGFDPVTRSFSGTPANADVGTTTITVTATDAGGLTASDSFDLVVTAVDDAPAISTPGAQVTLPNTALILSSATGNAISVTDIDAGNGDVQVTLTANQGTATLSQTAGLAFASGDGSADASMRFSGTLAAVNAALDGLTFNPTAGHVGSAGLFVLVDDLGNTGSDGPRSATANLYIDVSSDIRVNTVTSSSQTEPAVAMDGTGNYVVTWTSDNQDGSGKGIYAQRYDVDGNAVGTAFRVNATAAGNQTASAVGMAPDGRFVVVWTSSDSAGKGVYAQRYAADGTALGGEFRVNDATLGDQLAPQVAMTADGGFIVAWSSDSGLTRFDVFARRYDALGVALDATDVRVNTSLDKNQNQPAIAAGPAGEFVVTWTSTSTIDGSGTGIFAQRFAADGTPVGAEFLVNTTVPGNQDRPSVAIAPDGSFVITWSSAAGQDGDERGVFAQRFDAAGAKLGGEFQVNTHTAKDQTRPSVAVDASGSLTIAWSSKEQDGSGWGIYARNYAPDGTPAGAEYLVNSTRNGDQSQPVVASGPSAHWVVAWQGNGPGDSSGIFHNLTPSPNDAPQITAPPSVPGTEDVPVVLAGADRIIIADPDATTNPVQVTLSISHGTLSLAATAGLTFLVGDGSTDAAVSLIGSIDSINQALDGLRIDPPTHFHGTITLDITVDDLGYSGSGGSLTDAASVTIPIAAANDAPAAALAIPDQTATEDLPFSFSFDAATFTDPDGDTLSYSASGLPAWLAFDALTRTFSGTPASTDVGTTAITVTATDATGAIGSTGFALTVDRTNDAPAGTDTTISIDEGTTYTFKLEDFGFADPDDSPADAFLAVHIVSLPLAGTLLHGGSPVSAGQVVAATDIALGQLIFVPEENAAGRAYASFDFRVQDDGGTAHGGSDLDPAPATLTIDVIAINDAPTATGSAFLTAILEDEPNPPGATVAELFSANFANPQDASQPGHGEFGGIAVRGQSVNPAQGRWQYSTDNGVTWNNFGFISDANALALGLEDRLRFLPVADFTGSPNNLSVRLLDRSMPVTGGTSINVSSHGGTTPVSDDVVPLLTAVSPANDAPVLTQVSLTLSEGETVTLSPAEFSISDIDDSSFTFAVSAVTGGHFQLASTPGTPIVSFTSAELASGLVQFVDDGDETPPSFDVSVQDDQYHSNTLAAVVTFLPVNDSPRLDSASTQSANEDQRVDLALAASDAENDAIAFAITGGADAALFSIDAASGELRLTVIPNHEAPLDANGDNVYEVVVTVSDGHGGASSETVKLVVLDIVEPVSPVNGTPSDTPDTAETPPEATPDSTPGAIELLPGTPPPLTAPKESANGDSEAGLEAPTNATNRGDGAPALRPVLGALDNRLGDAHDPALDALQASLTRALDALAIDARALQTLHASLQSGDFRQQLNELQNDMRQMLRLDDTMVTSSLAVSTSLSVGYVLWLVRGGVLLSSLLSTLPAWQLMDPLPVLGHLKNRKGQDDQDDSLEGILKKSRAKPRPHPNSKEESSP